MTTNYEKAISHINNFNNREWEKVNIDSVKEDLLNILDSKNDIKIKKTKLIMYPNRLSSNSDKKLLTQFINELIDLLNWKDIQTQFWPK